MRTERVYSAAVLHGRVSQGAVEMRTELGLTGLPAGTTAITIIPRFITPPHSIASVSAFPAQWGRGSHCEVQ